MPPPFPIPVRAELASGPGSQPDDDVRLDVMPMPHTMHTFEMPRVPERVDPAAMLAARALLQGLLTALDPAAEVAPLELAGTAPAVLAIVDQVLGEGEVSVRIEGARPLRIQETVFPGLWRCVELDAGGALLRDWVEAGAMPAPVVEAARAAASTLALETVEPPEGAMNAPALLAEIAAALGSVVPGGPAHAINLTLLPLTPADHRMLTTALPVGPVAMISRGFGNCHVSSTGVRDVWRVQYFNSMQTLILDTIEVVDLPEVAIAAADDLADTRVRLAELLQWMEESAAAEADDHARRAP